MPEVEKLIGYALTQLSPDAPREAKWVARSLEPVKERKPVGKGYDKGTVDLYDTLIGEVEGDTSDVCGEALGDILGWAGDKKRESLNINDAEQRVVLARALKGLQQLASGLVGESDMPVSDPSMMGEKQRELYYARRNLEIKEKLGILKKDEYDRPYLLSLIGDLMAIKPEGLGNLLEFMQRDFSGFEGKFSDEMLMLMDAFGGGKEGGTFSAVLSLADISKFNMETYAGMLSKLKPHELYFLAQLPFTVVDKDNIERTITIAEVADFLLTPEGRKYFRMNPNIQGKFGISTYIDELGKKYPNANQGLTIRSRFRVIDPNTGKWKRADVLDEGKAGTSGLADVYVRMGENPTWLRFNLLARGVINACCNRGIFYRGGAVFALGPELQKSANAYPFYLEAYTNFDAWVRLHFPRFRSMMEYLMPTNPFDWFMDLATEGADYKDTDPYHPTKQGVDYLKPFDPRPFKDRRRGIVVANPEQLSDDDRVNDQLDILTTFFGAEEDPADPIYEEAIMDLVSAHAGYGIDYKGDKIKRNQVTGDALVKLAWEWRQKFNNTLLKQMSNKDKKLETLQNYRTFYPVPTEVVRRKLKKVPANLQIAWSRYDFMGMVQRYAEVDPVNKMYAGVSGMRELADAVGSGLWTLPLWGEKMKNAPNKHGDYEGRMLKIQENLLAMSVGSTQAKMGEAQERSGNSLAYGHEEIETRAVKLMDKMWNRLQGIQANPQLRGASLKEFSEAYEEALGSAGFMTGMHGAWYIYRYGRARVAYMAGLAGTPPYISGTRPSRTDDNDVVVHNPVTPGQALARYKDYYPNLEAEDLQDALAVMNAYVDEREIVYPARSAGLYPIAMSCNDRGVVTVDARRVNVAAEYGHMRQLPENPGKMIEVMREELLESIHDKLIDTVPNLEYFEWDINDEEEK
jgi:hypothetical protein